MSPAQSAPSDDGREIRARCALVCAGGLAAPKLGGCGDGCALLEGFDHRIMPRFPAIAALKTATDPLRGLKGIRAEGTVSLLEDGVSVRTERGEILFTEYGVSGIAAMQLARGVNEALRAGKRCGVSLNFAPEMERPDLALADRAKLLPDRRMEDFLTGIVPKRLGQALIRSMNLAPDMPAGELSRSNCRTLAMRLTGWMLPVTGTLGFDQAQVTAGGADLKEFDLRTMQSLRAPGLFAAGEVLDVDGDCGGFNLQWAWSSALMAAEGIAARLENEG